jgi:tRNA pseudouridine38-40 synthase
MKKRYFIELAFKGTAYHGWQKQPNAVTIQDEVDRALSVVLKEPIESVGAGRTDTGVHARFFMAHFDSDVYNPIFKSRFLYNVNSILPLDIVIKDIYPVIPEAHARFSALSRTYEYHISKVKDPFETDYSWHYPQPLDIERMNKASELLLLAGDFKSFSKYHTQVRTSICKVTYACWTEADTRIVYTIEADRFLRNMVRAIVGTLIEVGQGKISLDDFNRVILCGNRKVAGASAPAKALFLTNITYPEGLKLK